MRITLAGLVILTILTGCGTGSLDSTPEIVSKRDVMEKKADLADTCQALGLEPGCDLCAELDWYGDGECDRFCQHQDDDCQSCLVGDPAGCADDEFCYVAGGGCAPAGVEGAGVEGLCLPRRQECVSVYSIVCGCDGKNYVNSCDAARYGVNIRYHGACEDGNASQKPDADRDELTLED